VSVIRVLSLGAGVQSTTGTPFIHDSRVPLAEADIEESQDPQLSFFGGECQGMCGT
jgi:hypothetical protein